MSVSPEDRAEVWRLVDRALDARLDPLADPRVRAALDRHPELLESYAEVHATLRRLGDPTREQSRTPRRASRWPYWIAALVAASIALALVIPSTGERTESDPATLVMPTFSTESRVRALYTSTLERKTSAAESDGFDHEHRITVGNLSQSTLEVATRETPRVLALQGRTVHLGLAILTSQVRR